MNEAVELPELHLPPRYLRQVKTLLRESIPNADVWAYGSRVNGDHFDASDLDLVVRQAHDPGHSKTNLSQVRDAFSESDLPIIVQLVDWALIPLAFRDEIAARYVVVQSAAER